MNRSFTLLVAGLFLAAAPMSVLAQNHGSHSGHGGHAPAAHAGHSGHDRMEEVGVQVVEGVKAVALLDDVKEAMAKAGMKETHHFMVHFVEEQTGKRLEAGSVALKVKGPGGKESGPIRMMGMEGGFGADVMLEKSGHYEFTLGTRLADGKTRQFELRYMLD